MRGLRSLLYKEWRDQRALAVGTLFLCVLLLAVAKVLGGSRFDSVIRTQYVLPACLCLFAIALATESVARDAHEGVERTLGRIPASRTLVWLAKSGCAVLCSAGFLAVLALVELVLRGIEHRTVPSGTPVVIAPVLLVVICAAAAACMASSAVLRRSLPAAFVGVGLLFAGRGIAFVIPAGRAAEWTALVLYSWTPHELATLVCCAFLVGSWLAFCVRRADRFGMRRASAAMLGVGVVLAPAIAGSAHQAAWAFDIVPFSACATISMVVPSPDGRFVALEVEQDWKARDNWTSVTGQKLWHDDLTRSEVWILDRSTAKWSCIDDRFRLIPASPVWDTDGRLVTLSAPGAFGDGELTREHIDPAAGIVVASQMESRQDSVSFWVSTDVIDDELVLRWNARGLELRLPAEAQVTASPQPGVVFYEQDGFLVRHEFDPDCTTRLYALHGGRPIRLVSPSPDGHFLHLIENVNDRVLLDACDGSVLRRFEPHTGWAGWSRIPGRICLVHEGEDEWFALEGDGSLAPMPARSLEGGVAFPPGGLSRYGEMLELGRDHLLACGAQRIECMKLDGSEREVLYEARP